MSDIYLEYQPSIKNLKARLTEFNATIDVKLTDISNYYLFERLPLLSGPVTIDRRFGAPIPYMIYWLSEHLALQDQNIIDDLALSLLYVSLANCARDDLVDEDTHFRNSELVSFANTLYCRYLEIFKSLFPETSSFWSLLAKSQQKWAEYEIWSHNYSPSSTMDTFSGEFLSRSSSYLVSITFPSLAAVAFLTKNRDKIKEIYHFLENYWMGWKILDDIKDWHKDIIKQDFNKSSFLYSVLARVNEMGIELNKNSVLSLYHNEIFIKSVYTNVDRFYSDALSVLSDPKPIKFIEFINRQIDYNHSQVRNFNAISNDLNKTLISLGNKA